MRISHAHRATEYAEKLLKRKRGDYLIVIGTSVFRDIGIHQARRILTRLGFEQNQVEEICEIIAHHHSPVKIVTNNFRILYDADLLVNLREEYDIQDRDKMSNIVDKMFLTQGSKTLSKKSCL